MEKHRLSLDLFSLFFTRFVKERTATQANMRGRKAVINTSLTRGNLYLSTGMNWINSSVARLFPLLMVSELERVYCYFVLPNIDSCRGWGGEIDSRFCFLYRKNEEIVELITKGDSKAFDVDVLKAFIKLLPDNTEVSRKTFFFLLLIPSEKKLSGRISHHSSLAETVLKLPLLKTDTSRFRQLNFIGSSSRYINGQRVASLHTWKAIRFISSVFVI